MYGNFAESACNGQAETTMNAREMWLQLEASKPYEGSIYCDVPVWPSSIRVLVKS